MGRAKDDGDVSPDFPDDLGFEVPDNRPLLFHVFEEVNGKAKGIEDLFRRFPGPRVEKARGAGVGPFLDLLPGQAVHEVFGEHEEVGHAFEAPRLLVRVKLVDRVEGGVLDARDRVEAREGDEGMDFLDRPFRSLIAVAIARLHGLVALEEDVIDPPGIDGKALDIRAGRDGFADADHDFFEEAIDVPDEVAILDFIAIRETMDLGKRNLPGREFRAEDGPAGGGAEIDREDGSCHVSR